MDLIQKISPTLRGVTFAAMILLVASAEALAQNLPPPGAYQPIPNFTGVGAGLQFREAINDRFSGAQPIAPSIARPAFANLPAEQDGMLLFCKDCKSATPCVSGGSGAFAFGQGGLWSCAGAATTWPASLTQNLLTGGHAINGNTSSGGDQINNVSVNGVLNAADFGAVCSNTTESATTTAGNATVTVSAIGDIKVGQYVKIGQAGASNTIATPAISSVALNSYHLNGLPTTAPICEGLNGYNCTHPTNTCQTDTLTSLPSHNATCTTEYCYTVQNIGQTGIGTATNGMRSAQSAAVCVTGGPSKLSVDNEVIVKYSTDANTVGTIIRQCNGLTSCTPTAIAAVMPNYLPAASGTLTYADMGNHFGTDEDSISGTGAVAADLDAQVIAISGLNVAVSPAPSQTIPGGTMMRHDNAPAFQQALNASCASGSINCSPVYVPACPYPYPLSQALSLWGLTGAGFVGANGSTGGNGWPTQLQWDGPIGGIVFNGNYSGEVRFQGIAVPGGYNSPGVFIDINRYGTYTVPSTQGPGAPSSSATQGGTPTHWTIANVECGQGVSLCYGLRGTQNTENMTFINSYCDNGYGSAGGWTCYGGAWSQETYNEVINGGTSAARDFAFNFPSIGSFQIRDQNTSANLVDFDIGTISNSGSIDGGVDENSQYFEVVNTVTGHLKTANWRVNPQGVPDGHIASFGGNNEVDNVDWSPTYGTANNIAPGGALFTNNIFQYGLANPFGGGSYPAQPCNLPFDDGGGGNYTPAYTAIHSNVNVNQVQSGYSGPCPFVISNRGYNPSNSYNPSGNLNNAWFVNTTLLSQAATDDNSASSPAAILSAPPSPTLSSSAGGSLSATTYYKKSTYVNATGETVGSSENSLAVAVNYLLVVPSPPAIATATGWNVYVSTATGTETKQNATPISIGTSWTEPTTGLISGSAIPGSNAAQMCGTSPSGSVGASGTNNAFTITVGGSSSMTACGVEFSASSAFANAPVCTCNDVTAGVVMKQSQLTAAGILLTTTASDMHGDTINCGCAGK